MTIQCPDCDAWCSPDAKKCPCGYVFVVEVHVARSAVNELTEGMVRTRMNKLDIERPRPGESQEQYIDRCKKMYLDCKTQMGLDQL